MKAGPITKLKKRLWTLCREIILARYGRSCFTCYASPLVGSNCHVGHFITSSICSMELRYDLRNLRPQCFACNIHKSGNWPAFEARLIADEGQEYVDDLKRRNAATKGGSFGVSWLEAKVAEYEKVLSTLPAPEGADIC